MGAQKSKEDKGGGDVNVNQVDDNSGGKFPLYSLVNAKGGGELLELTREAIRTKNWRPLEQKIRSDAVRQYLYDGGNGRDIPIKHLVDHRNKLRKEKQDILPATNGRTNSMNSVNPAKEVKTRKICWDLDKRGAVGETILHLCFLNATEIHNELAKRIIAAYPLLVNDIHHTDMYYGESCLHFAIVNEDFTMVKFLVENGADINERAYGSFFLPTDQENRHKDTYAHEEFIVDPKTDYKGHTYFGEYPLSFAACLEQEDILRYLWSKGADVNAQDSNGNTALHMTVLNQKMDQFTQCFELGGKCSITNRQGYTPLSLAAEQANTEFFEMIIYLERQVSWKYGNVTCALYPLYNLDSIAVDGSVNEKSALYTIVNKSDIEHLSLMKGLMTKLLHEKWKTFGRFQFYVRMAFFIIYLILLTTAFYLRPGKDPKAVIRNETDEYGNVTTVVESNGCYLLYSDTKQDKIRLVFECMTFVGAICFLAFAAKELFHLKRLYKNVLLNAPAKAMFLLSCFFLLLAGFGRIPPCFPYYEDVMVILCILSACPFFLFFLRVYALLGPFIFMIYRMITGDLLKFLLLYLIFFVGFSQAMHIVFLGSEEESNFGDSLVSMFVMSLGEFGDVYERFGQTNYPHMAKFLFFVYMVLVTLLLVNMLIAMMGNTFSTIANADYEWKRQWAKVVLVLEQTLAPDARQSMQQLYSQPYEWEGQKGRSMVQQTEHEKHDDREVQKSRQRHNQNAKKRFHNGEWQYPSEEREMNASFAQGYSVSVEVPETKIIPPDVGTTNV